MHRALLIDEVLQVIFDLCSETGKKSLCSLARCCKAWKDPALDRIWKRLLSIAPLLSLIPGAACTKRSIDIGPLSPSTTLAVFRSYAKRIRRITNQQSVNLDPSVLSHLVLDNSLDLLPSLTFARIDASGWGELQNQMSISAKLRTLELDLGFIAERIARNTILACELLMQVAKGTALERLYIRGTIGDCFNHSLRSLISLRSVTLHVSNSLTTDTLMAVSTLPALVEFDIQAGNLAAEQLIDVVNAHSQERAAFFPALQKLRIRAHAPVVECILRNLPHQTIRTLRIDAELPTGPPSSWNNVFHAISAIAPTSLDDLTIEHSIDIDDLDDTQPSPYNHFTLDDLRPLSKLPLRRFILDTLVPPDLADRDVEELATWWPHLEQLELGAPAALECVGEQWRPKTSLSCLAALAKRCKKLEHLVMTLDAASGASLEGSSVQLQPHPLRQLTIGSHCSPEVQLLSTYIDCLFPSLTEVYPGLGNDDDEQWRQVRANLVRR
ncbi:hypothetical protein BV22DRAFT_1096712 [Leucogyrophana mollusca]|uniref:Uncharacterized protein n=1 Tax=Leucogyrophana mollusca TaxID=85980 RepID=A0ACB8B680_9AGAM|nr:hypothetical protein BV22DRAFT_1096712 [Leucogyrophana mollusca]